MKENHEADSDGTKTIIKRLGEISWNDFYLTPEQQAELDRIRHSQERPKGRDFVLGPTTPKPRRINYEKIKERGLSDFKESVEKEKRQGEYFEDYFVIG